MISSEIEDRLQALKNNMLQCVLFLFLFTACVASSEEPRGTVADDQPQVTLRVLSIGNSFSVDAFSYLPCIVHGIAPNVHITMGLLNHGGATLAKHWEFVEKGAKYQYYYKADDNNHWTSPLGDSYAATIAQAINDEPWDVVILQQGSSQCRDWSTYQPALNHLVEWIQEQAGPDVVIAWMQIPAFAEGFERLCGSTSDEMYNDITQCSQHVMSMPGVGLLLPVGTAIQNARQTSLARYGQFGNLTFDGMHMNDGIGCLIETYTAAQVLLDFLKVGATIDADASVINQDWLGALCVQQQNGNPVGVTPENRAIAKACVKAALQHPYAITSVQK